jgi:hypothetical protein
MSIASDLSDGVKCWGRATVGTAALEAIWDQHEEGNSLHSLCQR